MFNSVRVSSNQPHRGLCRYIIGLFLLSLIFSSSVHAADPISYGFHKRTLKDDSGEHRYVVYIPFNYSPEEKSPVILFLHGGGERGTDGVKQTHVGLAKAIQKRYKKYPYITVFPQCEDEKGPILSAWSADRPDGKRAMKILKQVEEEFSTDSSRRFLTGWSMGGYGAWSLAAAHPKEWKSVVLLSGGGDPSLAKQVKEVPIWLFHGQNDDAVRTEESDAIAEALKKAEGKFLYTVIPDEKHDTWESVYLQPELYEWMENPTFDKTPEIQFTNRIEKTESAVKDKSTFVSSVDIPDALSLRIGNKVLSMISHDLPSMIPTDTLSGSLPDIHDSTTTSGRTFSVRFSGISYSGQISNAHVNAYTNDRINIQVALSNVRLNIGRTYVNGRSRSAVAGPITVSFGHAGPVWLSFDVTPYIQNRQLKLRHVGTNFQIPRSNFSVSAPAGVSVDGWGMTSEAVSSGLVNGLYSNRGRIEREVSSVIPNMLPKLEQQLDFSKAALSIEEFWFLPVYKPDVQLWPSHVSVDPKGISLRLGLSAQGFKTSQAGQSPKIVTIAKDTNSAIPAEDNFELAFAPKLIQEMTQLLVDDGVAHIHFSDIPGNFFDRFSNPKVMSEFIPELKKFGDKPDLWAELYMESSVNVHPIKKPENKTASTDSSAEKEKENPKKKALEEKNPETDATKKTDAAEKKEESSETNNKNEEQSDTISQTEIGYSIPKLLIVLSVANPEKPTERISVAQFELSISQNSDISILQPEYSTRSIQMKSESAPQIEIKGGFVEGYKAENPDINTDALKKLFLDGWNNWTKGNLTKGFEVEDLAIGNSAFRLNDINWSGSYLVTEFVAPGIRLTNTSEQPLLYEMKTPTSSWGGPYTLNPGKTHFFEVNRPLQYRRREEGQIVEFYTLPVGSHSEFRLSEGKDNPALFSAKD